MSIFHRYPGLRWVIPVGITALVFSGGAMVNTITASADASLPERSATQLLVDLQESKTDGLSGTVTQRAELGLPNLPSLGGQGSTNLTSLVAGSHTLKVWYSGPDKARVALLGTFGETDLIRNGADLWTWDSQRNTATHERLPDELADQRAPGLDPSVVASDPRELADLALDLVNPSTVVTTAGTARVAGRAAYELVLAPRDSTSLVSRVRIAIDATEHMPLRVQVYPKGSDDLVLEVAFTQVNFSRPDDAQFRFNPPAGAKIIQGSANPDPSGSGSGSSASDPTRQTSEESSVVIGDGWTSVLVMLASPATSPSTETGSSEIASLLDQLPAVSGSWGNGHLLSGKVFSALLTDDGRVLVGLVSPERLTQVAADPKASLSALQAASSSKAIKGTK